MEAHSYIVNMIKTLRFWDRSCLCGPKRIWWIGEREREGGCRKRIVNQLKIKLKYLILDYKIYNFTTLRLKLMMSRLLKNLLPQQMFILFYIIGFELELRLKYNCFCDYGSFIMKLLCLIFISLFSFL